MTVESEQRSTKMEINLRTFSPITDDEKNFVPAVVGNYEVSAVVSDDKSIADE